MPNLLNDTNLFAKVLKTLDILQTKCELIFEPTLRDRTKITWHKLPAKVPKRPDILLTECQVIFEPTLRYFLFLMTSLLISETSCANKVDLIN